MYTSISANPMFFLHIEGTDMVCKSSTQCHYNRTSTLHQQHSGNY